MPATTPVTQRDVADACGLHPSTVCLALKNSPSIPLETRRRIQACAEELGYQPNVAARNLALLRSERRTGGSLPVAWINQEPRRDHWRADPDARRYFEGARRRAEELGYHLEEIWTREPGMSGARIVQILKARGIGGVLFPAHHSFDFSLLNSAWTDFALVGFNDHRLGEWIDLVCPDYYGDTGLLLRQLRGLGFERAGLVISPQFDAATAGLANAAFLRAQADVPAGDRVPVCFVPDAPAEAQQVLGDWLREQRPDVTMSANAALARWARHVGFDTAWAQLDGAGEPFDAGIGGAASEVAATAMECLAEKMRRFERGVRDTPRLHLIRGTWQSRGLVRREAAVGVA